MHAASKLQQLAAAAVAEALRICFPNAAYRLTTLLPPAMHIKLLHFFFSITTADMDSEDQVPKSVSQRTRTFERYSITGSDYEFTHYCSVLNFFLVTRTAVIPVWPRAPWIPGFPRR